MAEHIYEHDKKYSLVDYKLLFNDLPVEIQLHIFSFLSYKELCQSVACVCKQWLNLSQDPILWQSIVYIDLKDKHFNSIRKKIAISHYLKSIKISTRSGNHGLLPILMKNCPQLIHLDLGFETISLSSFQNINLQCKNLEYLNLEGTSIAAESLQAIESIVQLPKLKQLNLSHCLWVDNNMIFKLSSGKSKFEYFNIDGIPNIKDNATSQFILNNQLYLKELIVDGESLSNITFSNIEKCAKLIVFSSSFSESLDHGLESITQLTLLQTLRIRKGTRLTSERFIRAFAIGSFLHLTDLDLSECTGLSDAALSVLARKMPLLKKINLSWCLDVCSSGIVKVAIHCRQLECIIMKGSLAINDISFELLVFLLPQLHFIDLQDVSSVSDDVIKMVVQKSSRYLAVINYYNIKFCSA